MATTTEIDWLEALETRVRQAAGRLHELKEENRALARRVEALESELEETRRSGDAASGWERERDEIRRRVERLADGLEELIQE
jgi:predicted RNase H-like nuclease (RuvC/YqgF family)